LGSSTDAHFAARVVTTMDAFIPDLRRGSRLLNELARSGQLRSVFQPAVTSETSLRLRNTLLTQGAGNTAKLRRAFLFLWWNARQERMSWDSRPQAGIQVCGFTVLALSDCCFLGCLGSYRLTALPTTFFMWVVFLPADQPACACRAVSYWLNRFGMFWYAIGRRPDGPCLGI